MEYIIHMQVRLTGVCTKCGHHNVLLIRDFGHIPAQEAENAIDGDKFEVAPIPCKKCGVTYPPEFLNIIDAVRDEIIVKSKINHDHLDPETSDQMNKGHDQRFQIYKQYEPDFWVAFNDYAIAHWASATQELSKIEIAAGFLAIQQELPLKSDTHARREAQKVPYTNRTIFWRAANQEFIEDLLDIGAMGWPPLDYANHYGMNRTRFAIMHLPIAEALETLRNQYIGMLFKPERGDNEFLMRRLVQMTKEAQQKNERYNQLVRRLDEQKHLIADLRHQLNEAVNRHPDDIRRIHYQKSFIQDLKNEIKRLEERMPVTDPHLPEVPVLIPPLLEHSETHTDRFEHLTEKTVLILGGYSAKQVYKEYPCTILSHDGRKLDPDFFDFLKQADGLIVLTPFIGHRPMLAAKEYVKLKDRKPVCFLSETNLERLLEQLNLEFEKRDSDHIDTP